jgi:hypothetical protein
MTYQNRSLVSVLMVSVVFVWCSDGVSGVGMVLSMAYRSVPLSRGSRACVIDTNGSASTVSGGSRGNILSKAIFGWNGER